MPVSTAMTPRWLCLHPIALVQVSDFDRRYLDAVTSDIVGAVFNRLKIKRGCSCDSATHQRRQRGQSVRDETVARICQIVFGASMHRRGGKGRTLRSSATVLPSKQLRHGRRSHVNAPSCFAQCSAFDVLRCPLFWVRLLGDGNALGGPSSGTAT